MHGIERKSIENWVNGKQEICLENWLDSEGQFKPNKSEMTFGHGYRDCVGKMLAMKEMHIVMGYLLMNYKFEFDHPDKVDIKKTEVGVSVIKPAIGVKISKYQ